MPNTADPDPAARLLDALQGLDLTSADGRAGIGALLAELERLSPDAILRHAAADRAEKGGGVQAE